MSDLISRSELIDYFYYGIDDKPIIDGISDRKIIDIIKNQPTAYSVAKVVEKLEELKTRYFLTIANTEDEKSDFAYENVGNALDKAIKIVKHGGVDKDCNNCANYTESDEIDNGCYLCCKGYENNYKPKVDNDGMSDDVCEYKEQKNKFGQHIFITSCDKDLIQYGFMFEYNYCPYCGKKIKAGGENENYNKEES